MTYKQRRNIINASLQAPFIEMCEKISEGKVEKTVIVFTTPRIVDVNFPILMRYIGLKTYRGFDDNGRREINCNKLDTVYISKEKAKQLMRDFNDQWCFVSSLTGEDIW